MLGGTVIYNLLLNNTDITDIVGDNIYPLYIPQEIPLPCITYQMVSTDPNGTKDGVSSLDVERYQVNVYSDNFNEMNDLQKLVRTTLDFYTGEVAGLDVQRVWFEGQFTGFSDSSGLTGVYQYSHDYHVRINPNQTLPQALELTYDDLANLPVTNPYSVSEWNTFFHLPTKGTEFTGVSIENKTVKLYGGSNITLWGTRTPSDAGIFFNDNHLVSIDDKAGCIVAAEALSLETNNSTLTSIKLNSLVTGGEQFCDSNYMLSVLEMNSLVTCGIGAFSYISQLVDSPLEEINLPSLVTAGSGAFSANYRNLKRFILPSLEVIGDNCFSVCNAVEQINIPSCTNLGSTVGNNNVFNDITGQTITLTVPSALMTCNSGSPDGDIQFLQSNNTVTIITV